MQNFQDIEHFIKTLSAAIKKKIPTKVSQLTNDAGYKTTDTTYKLSKTGSTVTLTGSDGSTTSVSDSNTTYSSLKNPYSLTIQNNGTTVASYDGSTAKTANFTNATASADGLMSKADKAKLDGINSSYATKSELSSHSQNTSNPHKVTASQVGALPLSGGSLTGNLTAPSFQTGTGGANYFQCRKFRGEGDANTYYHAVDFGCAGHNQVDFYEYGGKYVFHRHQQAAQSSGDMVIGEINDNGFVGKVNGHTINADVPAGAKFTDTTYSNATTSVAGLMSPTDKAKLDAVTIIEEIQWEKIYPVGSIYISANSTSPAELFGGTWEQIKDRFLLAAGDTYAAGSTGGEATHTLTVNEMPSHSHAVAPLGAKGGTNGNLVINDKYGAMSGADTLNLSGGNAFYARNTSIVGERQAHNNMPPYLTIYMWKRTA